MAGLLYWAMGALLSTTAFEESRKLAKDDADDEVVCAAFVLPKTVVGLTELALVAPDTARDWRAASTPEMTLFAALSALTAIACWFWAMVSCAWAEVKSPAVS